METIRRIYNFIHKARVITIVSLLIFIILLCAVNIVLRYLVTKLGARPFSWADEIMRMLVIWVAFLSASLGAKEGAHISLDNIVKKYFSAKAANILRKSASIIVLTVLALVIFYGVRQTINAGSSYLQNLPISNAWFYAAIPVGTTYLFIDYLLILIFGEHPFSNKKLATEAAVKE